MTNESNSFKKYLVIQLLFCAFSYFCSVFLCVHFKSLYTNGLLKLRPVASAWRVGLAPLFRSCRSEPWQCACVRVPTGWQAGLLGASCQLFSHKVEREAGHLQDAKRHLAGFPLVSKVTHHVSDRWWEGMAKGDPGGPGSCPKWSELFKPMFRFSEVVGSVTLAQQEMHLPVHC